MNLIRSTEFDKFPVGLVVTSDSDSSGKRIITYLNQYMRDELGIDTSLVGQPIISLFSKASRIMFDSYVLPLIIHEGKCVEVLLELQQEGSKKIPVSVNANLSEAQDIYWTFAVADKQKQLLRKLLDTQNELENKAQLLQQQSITDELTGLVNRRELKRQATTIMAQSQRSSTQTSLLMIDVDYFKQINDTLGHDVGDQTLIQLSRLLESQARLSDIICRFGGEEFIILMPETDSHQAELFARRLHRSIQQTQFVCDSITVSIGISSAKPADKIDFNQLVKQADEAMYNAKGQGRNTTCLVK